MERAWAALAPINPSTHEGTQRDVLDDNSWEWQRHADREIKDPQAGDVDLGKPDAEITDVQS